MDPIEDKLRKFYREKRREDEKSTPDFETLFNKLQPRKAISRSNFAYRIAATVAIIAIAITYYFYFHNSPPVTEIQYSTFNIQNSTLHIQPTKYIWTWRAPTDKLLDNANQTINKLTIEKL
jgi:hypothetical protein